MRKLRKFKFPILFLVIRSVYAFYFKISWKSSSFYDFDFPVTFQISFSCP